MAYDEEEELDYDGPIEEVVVGAAIVFPETVGECVDRLYALRAQRIIQEREIKERKRTEAKYKLHIISKLQESRLEGGQGLTATASISEKDVPSPKDWPSIWKWIGENDAFDMLQKRLSVEAVQTRLDDGVEIPGIEMFHKVDLSLTKRGKGK